MRELRFRAYALGMMLMALLDAAAIGLYWQIQAWRLPVVVKGVHAITLYGDGVTDDAAALQAWARGAVVVWPNGRRVGRLLRKKTFYVGARWWIPGDEEDSPRMIGDDCRFVGPFSERWV